MAVVAGTVVGAARAGVLLDAVETLWYLGNPFLCGNILLTVDRVWLCLGAE